MRSENMTKMILMTVLLTRSTGAFAQAFALPNHIDGPAVAAKPVDRTLKLKVDSRIDPLEAESYEQLTNHMNTLKIGIPQDRIEHFSKAIGPKSPAVFGWTGYVQKVNRTRTGYVVQIRVHAAQEQSFDSFCVVEQYLVHGRNVTYMGSYVPEQMHRIRFSP